MVKKILIKISVIICSICSEKLLKLFQKIIFNELWQRGGGINREFFDDYSASTSLMTKAINCLNNSNVSGIGVLSIGGSIKYIVPLLSLVKKYHERSYVHNSS